jgi:uncharacterized membrane protein
MTKAVVVINLVANFFLVIKIYKKTLSSTLQIGILM